MLPVRDLVCGINDTVHSFKPQFNTFYIKWEI